jgi:hypothetical protein
VVGKVKLAALPRPEHPWLVALAVTEVGLTTSPIQHEDRVFAIDLDFADHQLRLSEADGGTFELDLEPMTVAHFYRQVMAGLAEVGIDLQIRTKPFEVADALPFDEDVVHSSYDKGQVTAFHAGLVRAHRFLEEYQHGFSADASPVVFYWGSFDLSTSRFSTSSDETGSKAVESACGWWPLDQRVGPAFYAYTSPAPSGFEGARVRPDAAYWDETLGEFILAHDPLLAAADPDSDIRAFLETTWRAGQLKLNG